LPTVTIGRDASGRKTGEATRGLLPFYANRVPAPRTSTKPASIRSRASGTSRPSLLLDLVRGRLAAPPDPPLRGGSWNRDRHGCSRPTIRHEAVDPKAVLEQPSPRRTARQTSARATQHRPC